MPLLKTRFYGFAARHFARSGDVRNRPTSLSIFPDSAGLSDRLGFGLYDADRADEVVREKSGAWGHRSPSKEHSSPPRVRPFRVYRTGDRTAA